MGKRRSDRSDDSFLSPLFHLFTGNHDPRPWVAPDIAVELSSADYFAGLDPVLQAAIDD